MSGVLIKKFDEHKSIIILISVACFALFNLIFTMQYSFNFPYSMDYLGIVYLEDYIINGVFPFEKLTESYNGHFLITPRLVVLPNLLLNSYDFENLYYLQWIFMSLALFFIFLLLKRTDKRLYWILIPISAFIFSPLQTSGYWGFAILLWLIPPSGVILVIYLLGKTKIDFKIFSAATAIAIATTFSSIIGIVVWLPGIISLIRYNRQKRTFSDKKWLWSWIICTGLIGLTYYTFVERSEFTPDFASLFTITGYNFIATFTAVAFRLKFDFLMILVGTGTLLLSAYCVYYFAILKKKIFLALPWLLFILVGVADAFIIGVGRIHLGLHPGNEPYYIPMSHFTQIGLLVLTSLIILDIKNNPKNKQRKVLLAFFISIIIFQMVLLIPSYYSGLQRGEYYFEEKSQYLECFTLSHNADCLKEDGNVERHYNNIRNYWLENKLSIFGDDIISEKNLQVSINFEKNWFNDNEIHNGFGEIETINNNLINNQKLVYVDSPIIIISGWTVDQDKNQLKKLFLLVDNEPFFEYNDFLARDDLRRDNEIDDSVNPGWRISFLSGYLDSGCHKITVAGISSSEKILVDQDIQICKEN